jgi:septal ring factor EnvC (AmiA/AmiB activator)
MSPWQQNGTWFLCMFQGHLLQGLSFQQLNQFQESIAALLTALDLDPDNADKLTNHIASTVARFCNISKELARSLKGEHLSMILPDFCLPKLLKYEHYE